MKKTYFKLFSPETAAAKKTLNIVIFADERRCEISREKNMFYVVFSCENQP